MKKNTKIMFLGSNIRHLRKVNNLTQDAMGALFDVSRDNIASYERGTEPSLTLLKKIGNYFHISMDKLYSVDLKNDDIGIVRENETVYQGATKNIGRLKTDRDKQLQRVPLYDVKATAGIVDLLGVTHKQRHIPIDYIVIPNMPKCDGALPITGDSMYPILKSGDIILYKEVHDKSNIIWGEMYLAAVKNGGDEYIFTKYIQKSERHGYAKFVSENRHHQPVEFKLDDIVAIALIKASIRFNSAF